MLSHRAWRFSEAPTSRERELEPIICPLTQQVTPGRSELPSGARIQDPHLREGKLPQVSAPINQELTEKCGFLEPVKAPGLCSCPGAPRAGPWVPEPLAAL